MSLSPGSQRAHIYAGNITSAITGFDTNVANSAAIASPILSYIQDGALLDINVLGCVHYRTILKDERIRTTNVLSSITGLDYGDDFVLWNAWWQNNREKILKRKPR